VPFSGISADSTRYDKGKVTPRAPSSEQINEYKSDKDFQYQEKYVQDTSWWDNFIRWLKSLLRLDRLGESGEVITWILAGCFIAGLLFFIFRNDIGLLFSKSNKTDATLAGNFAEISMDQVSIESLLKTAIADKNYGEAVRLYYILALKNLSESGNINLRKDKTNREYLSELIGKTAYQPFDKLTFYFEYIFYGKFDATEAVFSQVQENYNNLLQNSRRVQQR
jgi:hypothetical protein